MTTLTRPTTINHAAKDSRALVALAQAGDAAAFGELYRRYSTTVYQFVLRRVGNPTVAEDLTSEAFTRALRGIRRFTWQGRDPISWFVTIASNLVRDHFRALQRHPEVVSDVAVLRQERHDATRDTALEAEPERAALNEVTGRALREAIGQLGPAQQECIRLRFFSGLSPQETAVRMGTTYRAVVSIQYRAVRALADVLPASAVVS